MEFCLALPADQKLRDGWGRLVMRRAVEGLVPEEVRWRSSKANLAPNFLRQLLGRDRSTLEDVIVKHPDVLEDYVDIPALRRALERYAAHPWSEADAVTVYSAVVLGLWLQRTKIAA
jgi:asparagine synthase (glutamine-hydrolysing)